MSDYLVRGMSMDGFVKVVAIRSTETVKRAAQIHGTTPHSTTTFGIHREDIALTLSGREMKLFASQGQIRTAALSMKLAQLEVFRQQTGEAPILLLDDVMSELDMTRRTRLLEEIDGVQTFVTCTDESDLEGCRERRSYQVRLTDDGWAHVRETTPGAEVNRQEMEDPDFS